MLLCIFKSFADIVCGITGSSSSLKSTFSKNKLLGIKWENVFVLWNMHILRSAVVLKSIQLGNLLDDGTLCWRSEGICMFTFSFVVEVRGQHKLQNAASSCNKEEYFDKGHFSWMDVVSTIAFFK